MLSFKADGTRETDCGNPYRAVPRVTMSEVSTRSSTGTRIGEGVGGAVRAAASAGDMILEAATQPMPADSTISPRTTKSIKIRLLPIRIRFL
jgi:hypothetical protein